MSNQKQPKITGVTPVGVASYPYLNKPDTKYNADGEFKVSLALGGEETEALRAQIDEMTAEYGEKVKAELQEKLAAAKTGAEKAKIKKAIEGLTINLPYSESVDDDGEPDGGYILKFKSKAQFKDKKTGKAIKRTIRLFDAKKKSTTVAVFSGSQIKVAYELSPYFVSGTGAYGVSLRLNAVQIIELSQGSGGGNASGYGFDEEEGYESSDEDNQNNSEAEGGDQEGGDEDDF